MIPFQQSVENIISGRFPEQHSPLVPLGYFREMPFILLSPDSDITRRVLELCRNYGFRPRVSLTLEQQLTTYNIICGGFGASFISDTLAGRLAGNRQVLYYKLDSELSERTVSLYNSGLAVCSKERCAIRSNQCLPP